jgi:hypothetical protein
MYPRSYKSFRNTMKAVGLLVGVGVGFVILLIGMGEFLPNFMFEQDHYDICECLANNCRR